MKSILSVVEPSTVSTMDEHPQTFASKHQDTDVWLLEDVATVFSCHRNTVYNMIRREGLPAYKRGGKYYFLKSEVMQWLRMKPFIGS